MSHRCPRALSWGLMLALTLGAAPTWAAGQDVESSALAPAPMPVKRGQAGHLPGDSYWNNAGGLPSSATPPAPPEDVNAVTADSLLAQRQAAGPEVPWARASAIQGAAVAYGVQAGLASRAYQINQSLDKNARAYDRVFNFNAVMLEPGFLPPVISEGRDNYNQPNARVVRAADRLYRIEFPARLVSAAPTWRDYLPVAYATPAVPQATVLPKNAQEKKLWDAWAKQGWGQGVRLADETFEANNGRLKRDFEGMIRYKALYEQGVVSKPVMKKANLGVTGGGSEMAVNDRVYEITRDAGLDPDRKRWSSPMPKTASGDRGTPDPVPSTEVPRP